MTEDSPMQVTPLPLDLDAYREAVKEYMALGSEEAASKVFEEFKEKPALGVVELHVQFLALQEALRRLRAKRIDLEIETDLKRRTIFGVSARA